MWVFFFRVGFLGVALAGWVGYQLMRKKRSWQHIQGDAFMALVFIAVWGFIYYLIIS
jgi:hypothetical protein